LADRTAGRPACAARHVPFPLCADLRLAELLSTTLDWLEASLPREELHTASAMPFIRMFVSVLWLRLQHLEKPRVWSFVTSPGLAIVWHQTTRKFLSLAVYIGHSFASYHGYLHVQLDLSSFKLSFLSLSKNSSLVCYNNGIDSIKLVVGHGKAAIIVDERHDTSLFEDCVARSLLSTRRTE